MNLLTLSLFLSMHSQTHFNHMPLLALVVVAEARLGCVCVWDIGVQVLGSASYHVAVVTFCSNSAKSSCRRDKECMSNSCLMGVHDSPSFQRPEINLSRTLTFYAVLT